MQSDIASFLDTTYFDLFTSETLPFYHNIKKNLILQEITPSWKKFKRGNSNSLYQREEKF